MRPSRLADAGKHRLPSTPARIQRDLDLTIECMVYLKRRRACVPPGGDYGFLWNRHGQNARDLAYFADLMGFTPMEAIVAATRDGGALMGLGDELGQDRPGYLADLMLVDGDLLADVSILENCTRLIGIMKDGVLHKRPPRAATAA